MLISGEKTESTMILFFLLRPVLTYAAETRTQITKTKGMLRSVEMRGILSIRGVTTLRDEIWSTVIRKDLNIQYVVRFTRSRRKHWRYHVDRMGTADVQSGLNNLKPPHPKKTKRIKRLIRAETQDYVLTEEEEK